MKTAHVVFAFLLAMTSAGAAILPYPSSVPSVADYDAALLSTWNGIKKRNIDPYTVPLCMIAVGGA